MKTALVLGGGGFIGGHLANRLKRDGFYVRIADIEKRHKYWRTNEICDEYMSGDLRDPDFVKQVLSPASSTCLTSEGFDEVYQLAADMGGAGYIFTGDNDANVMHCLTSAPMGPNSVIC
ncbi:NAD-dependent epimerase/dehydratase family protein [Planktomarina temperata]|nr:NAD-dependent epimerase/dehydratase family protein [Planktomarina temperata]MDB2459775.1 NAD-dependent epimerase/dehydratase family protein [Planktomarina temperata]